MEVRSRELDDGEEIARERREGEVVVVGGRGFAVAATVDSEYTCGRNELAEFGCYHGEGEAGGAGAVVTDEERAIIGWWGEVDVIA